MSVSLILKAFDGASNADLGQTGHSIAHSIQPAAVLRIGEPDMPRNHVPLWLVRPGMGQLTETEKYSLEVSPRRKGKDKLRDAITYWAPSVSRIGMVAWSYLVHCHYLGVLRQKKCSIKEFTGSVATMH